MLGVEGRGMGIGDWGLMLVFVFVFMLVFALVLVLGKLHMINGDLVPDSVMTLKKKLRKVIRRFS